MRTPPTSGKAFNVYRVRLELLGVVEEGTAIASAERLLRKRGALPCDVRIPGLGWFVWEGERLIPAARELP